MADRAFPDDSNVKHGTPSGWSLHQKLEQDPCDACYRAKAEYDKRTREATPRVIKNRLDARAQNAASKEIRRRYAGEYNALYRIHKRRLYKEAGVDLPDSYDQTPTSGEW